MANCVGNIIYSFSYILIQNDTLPDAKLRNILIIARNAKTCN